MAAVIIFLGVLAVFRFLRRIWHDPREPPLIHQRIPLVGHIIGLHRRGLKYFNHLTSAHDSPPIYTLKVLHKTLYVVNNPNLAKAVEQNTKALSFLPLEVAVSERILKIRRHDMRRVRADLDHGRGRSGYLRDLHNTHQKVLSPGPALTRMGDQGLYKIVQFLNDQKGGVLGLYAWTRHVFTVAMTTAVWGQASPFTKDFKLEDSFWIVEEKLKILLVDIYPNYATPSGSKSREHIFHKFLDYYNNCETSSPSTSKFVKAKSTLNQEHGFSNEYMARTDLGELTAVLFNIVPASFWLLTYIFSNPALLADIREELETMKVTPRRRSSCSTRAYDLEVDITRLQQSRLLTSTYYEVLRLAGAGVTTNRVVLEDTLLFPSSTSAPQDSYLLKKGALVQIPNSVIHADPRIWGPDVESFNPRRFLDNPALAASSAFRTFGGGASMCPGRHFSFRLVLAFVAAVVEGFEVVPVGDGGGDRADGEGWLLPEMDWTRLPGLLKPVGDLRVRLERRDALRFVHDELFT